MTKPDGRETRIGPDGTAYLTAKYSGHNDSGFIPIGAEVIILTDRVAETSKGGIIRTSDWQERANLGSESGVVVALGGAAFAGYPDHEVPKPGTRVLFEKFAGRLIESHLDGQQYRVMTFSCIGALEAPEPKKRRKP